MFSYLRLFALFYLLKIFFYLDVFFFYYSALPKQNVGVQPSEIQVLDINNNFVNLKSMHV